LLHTSDVHLTDNPESTVGLIGAVDVALDRKVDLVLIAGDLFDHSRVGAATVERAIEQLARLTQPVVVIPGNHDQVDERSIYHQVDLESAGDHVTFVGAPGGRQLLFDSLSLAIWARGIEDHHPGHRPLHGYQPAGPGYWNVVLTHGHYVPDGQESARSSQITETEIRNLGCDYLALGHWHRFLDVSAGGVAAFYSGSPWEHFGDLASVSVVSLDPAAGVSVERVDLTPTVGR
jgi:DNA repair exonuclease SbcCD nuclease subunit